MRPFSKPISLSFKESSLVFGDASSKSWEINILFSFARFERIDLIADLYIFLLIFLGSEDLDLAANVTPPPFQIGLLDVPALALPVPFCLQGFFPPPLTWDLFFCALVPWWLLSMYELTNWAIRFSFTFWLNKTSETGKVLFFELITGNSISIFLSRVW